MITITTEPDRYVITVSPGIRADDPRVVEAKAGLSEAAKASGRKVAVERIEAEGTGGRSKTLAKST